MNFLPPENNAMSNLLDIIADPKKAKQRLDDLNKQHEAIGLQVEEQRKAAEQARLDRETAERSLAELKSVREDNENRVLMVQADLNRRMDAYSKAHEEFNRVSAEHIREYERRTGMLDDRERDLGNRELMVNSRELAVATREAEVDALKKDYQAKVDYYKHAP